jgi:hypothetical protein
MHGEMLADAYVMLGREIIWNGLSDGLQRM